MYYFLAGYHMKDIDNSPLWFIVNNDNPEKHVRLMINTKFDILG